jgi:hypothetical protein
MSVDVETNLESSGSELTRVEWAPVPRVNLLPPEILEVRRFRRLQRQLAGIVLSVVLLGAAAGAWAQSGVLAAQSDLTDVQAQTQDLMQQRARYAEVPKALAELDAARAAREGALRSDVLWYRFLGDLAVNTPAGTELTTVSVTMNATTATAAGAAATGTAPAGTSSVAGTGTLTTLGEVKVAGKALRFRDVATWLETVTQVHGLAASNLQSVAREESSSTAGSAGSADVSYNGSAVVTSAALSHRYDRKAG